MMILTLLVFIAGRMSVTHQSQELEEQCYSVGKCLPEDEPKGNHSHICGVYETSVTCMQKALEACQQLNFPPEIVEMSADRIKELRHNLDLQCADLNNNNNKNNSNNNNNNNSNNNNNANVRQKNTNISKSKKNGSKGRSEMLLGGDRDSNRSDLPSSSTILLLISLSMTSLTTLFSWVL